ncbi:MAG: Hsp20/alpha crystallin family protein [Armatimonadetes bacterium]|nr:Hsp20/alpha crystallin family protein [Armatimonadota bacterium]
MSPREDDEWLDQISKEMERLAGEMAGAGLKPARSKGWSPRVDVLETESHVVLKFELAGVRAEKVALHYSAPRRCLTIRGLRYDEIQFPGEKRVAHQLEIDYGEFWREIALPDVALNVDNVKASFRSGMMMIAIPKAAEQVDVVVVKTVTIKKL